MTSKNKLKTASVLAFESKLATSDAIMESGNWDDRRNAETWPAILVKEKSVRGTISNRLSSPLHSDPAKIDASVQKANLQTVDTAALPFGHDTLKLTSTLRVIAGVSTPCACNCPDYQAALSDVIEHYVKENGFTELAGRYATNIANGRFLWKNRVGAQDVEVQVECGKERWIFDSYQFDLNEFKKPTGDVAKLAKVIETGLSGGGFVLLKITAFSRLGSGQTVFPSQELVLNTEKGKKSKFLYQLDGVAAMHSQKLGNAIRTIDTWHPGIEEAGPIAVEAYGSVTNRGKAYRQPKAGVDFYKLLDNWVLKGEAPEREQQHYVMAMLVRGGVFGSAG